jgi:hypothetical protein
MSPRDWIGVRESRALVPLLARALFARLISHQPAVLFSQNEPATSNQPQPVSSTLLSEQTSTNHQPPANRTGCRPPFRGSPREAPFLAQQVGFSSLPSDSVRQNTRNSNKVPISGFD